MNAFDRVRVSRQELARPCLFRKSSEALEAGICEASTAEEFIHLAGTARENVGIQTVEARRGGVISMAASLFGERAAWIWRSDGMDPVRQRSETALASEHDRSEERGEGPLAVVRLAE